MGAVKYWILWLLLWQVASAKELRCGPVLADVAAGSALKTGRLIMHDKQMPLDPHGALEPSLHSYVYNGDFAGFSKHLRMLSQHENFPSLLGALQAGDDRGMTVTHLLACAGRQHELSQLMDILFRMQGDGVEMIRRIVLESRNHDACKGKSCDHLEDRPGLYAHGTLHFRDPPQQVVLFGDVTPLECAAAHGHVQTMKVLIQGGVSAGKAFDVAKVFSLTNHLHQAIQLANEEGFLAQPKIFIPPSNTNSGQRQPRTRRSSRGSGSQSTARDKPSAPSKKGQDKAQELSPQQMSGFKSALTAALAEVSSSLSGTSSGTSSSNAADSTGAEGSAAQKSTKLSDMLDIAALLLLTGMLLLPLWSTICLLWRRAVRRRAAVTEPARRIKQAMIAATSGAVSRTSSVNSNASSSGGSTGDTVATVAGTKKCKASPGGTVRQRKGQPVQPSLNSSSTVASKATVFIPVSVSTDEAEGSSPLAPLQQQGSCTPPAAGAVESANGHGWNRAVLNTTAVSKCGNDASGVPGDSVSASDVAECAKSSASISIKQKCAKQQGPTSTNQRPSTAAAKCSSPAAAPAAPVPVSRSSSCSSNSLLGPATPADSMLDVPAAAAAAAAAAAPPDNAMNVDSTLGGIMAKAVFGAVEFCEVDSAAASDAAGSCRGASSSTATCVSSCSSSKRRVAGSRSVGTAAAAASATSPRSVASASAVDQQACKIVSPKRQQTASSSSGQRAGKGKQKGSKSAVTATAGADEGTRGSSSTTVSASQERPHRTVSAGPTLGEYSPVVVAPPELRALSADDAAQTAKAYAALIAPYTPSAAAAARPAIYQPPGSCAFGADVAGGASSANSHSRQQGQQGDVQCDEDLGGYDDVGGHQRDRCRDQESRASPAKTAAVAAAGKTASTASTAPAFPAAAGIPAATSAAVHMPAVTVELGSAAVRGAAANIVSSSFSSPAVLAPNYSAGSSSSASGSTCRDVQLQQQLCEGLVLQAANSGLPESSLSSCSSYDPTAVPNLVATVSLTGTVSRKLSDAASVHSDAGVLPTDGHSNSTNSSSARAPSALSQERRTSTVDPTSGWRSDDQSCQAEALKSPAAAAAGAGVTLVGSMLGSPAGRTTQQPKTAVARTLSGPLPGTASTVQCAASSSGPYRPLDRSSSTAAAGLSRHLPEHLWTADADAGAALHDTCNAHSSHSQAATAAASDAAAVLGSKDVVVAGPPRSSSSGGSAGNLRHSLASQMGLSVPMPHHQQQQQQQLQHPLSPNMQALAAQLLQRPVHASPNGLAHSTSPQTSVSPQMVAQIASRWQQQQQAVARASQQQQQWAASSMGQASVQQQQQQVQVVLQSPTSTGASGNQAVHLPAGMLALMQASSSHAAILQQQQQQARQQQKLMVFVPQQSGVQLSPSSATLSTLSPQQRAVLFSPGSGIPAVSLAQQPQPAAAVSAAPLGQQVAYLQQQQQQQVQIVQLHGALQGGPIRVFQPASVAAAVQQITQGPVAAAAGGGLHGAGQSVLVSPTGPGTAFVAGQRLTAAGPLSPAGLLPGAASAGMTAAAFAAVTSNTASTQLNAAQRGNSISASQQLLAMVPGLQQARQQQQQQGPMPVNKFDWSMLASDLAGRPVGPTSAGLGYDSSSVALPDPPGLVSSNTSHATSAGMATSPQAALAAMAAAAGAAGVKREGGLSVSVPECSPDADQTNESARMAAELDELLHQANQQLGWSGIPSAVDNTTGDDSNKASLASPATAAAVASPSTLKPDAPEYQPMGITTALGNLQSGTCPASTGDDSGGNSKSSHLKSLESLQLPDGFCSGD